MLMHIKTIMWVLDRMKSNVDEAESYIKKAHKTKAWSHEVADWCVAMSKKHMEFNAEGEKLLDRLCAELEQASGGGELMGAMKTMVHDKKAWIADETAEVKVMQEMYMR
jgi:hypothetical protein